MKEPPIGPIALGIILGFVMAFLMTLLNKPTADECAALGYPAARVTIWGERFCVDRRARSVPLAAARRAKETR